MKYETRQKIYYYHKKYLQPKRKELQRTHVPNEPWDYLIILDACRYDTFQKYNTIEGELTKSYSMGSNTKDFAMNNFSDEKYDDIVYVTGNPWIERTVKDQFHKIVSLWKYGWDKRWDTVNPGETTEAGIKTIHSHPKKRVIIHYLQPHFPCVVEHVDAFINTHAATIWQDVSEGRIKRDHAYMAYCINLINVLPFVERVIGEVDNGSRIVITADHGNLFGEFLFPLPIRGYAHPIDSTHLNLITVPWLVIEK